MNLWEPKVRVVSALLFFAVYLDESHVDKNYTVSKCWQSDEGKGILKKNGAGEKWIMAHAEGSKS